MVRGPSEQIRSPRSWVLQACFAMAIAFGFSSLGCAGKRDGNVIIEPPLPIIINVVPETNLLIDASSTPGYSFSLMTVNDRVQFHAIDPVTGNLVDDKVIWSLALQKSALDPPGTVNQSGLYVAPSSPTWVAIRARADNLTPPLRGDIGIEVVAAPVITSFSASSLVITSGQSTDLLPVFSSGTGQLRVGLQVLQPSIVTDAPVTVSPTSTTTYTLVVTNLAGAVVSQDLQVVVQ